MMQEPKVQRVRERAWKRGQRRFVAMLRTGDYHGPKAELYVEAERALDRIVDAEWEKAKAEFDAIQGRDHDYHELTGERQPLTCEDCNSTTEQAPPYGASSWDEVYPDWTEAEKAYGR